MEPNILSRGMSYEHFIRRAHKCENGTRHGAYREAMTNLIDAENGKRASWLPRTEKQFETVKKYVGKAFDKFLTKKLSDHEKNSLLRLKAQAENAYSSDGLSDIIEEALNLTQRFIEAYPEIFSINSSFLRNFFLKG